MNHGKQSQMTPLTDMTGYLLLKCNYDSKLLDQKPPLFLFIVKCLIFFKERRTGHLDVYRSEFILWNK